MRTKALFASACGPLLLSWALVTLASPLSGDIDKRAPCNRDNCLRGLIDGRWKSLGLEFCESIISYSPEVISTIYTTPIVTTTVSVPNSLVISTNQTITAPPAVEYVTEYTTVTAANATTRGINARLPLLRNTVRTTTSFMSTRTITRTYDNRKWGTIRMRDVAPTSTPAGLLKIISSCSSSRLSSACSCLTTEIPPVTTTTYLPFPIASTATEYATLDPATVTYTVLVTSTVVSTVTHVDTISTVRNYPAIAIPRFRAGTTTTTVNRVSTITYTSCLYTPTTPANANFDKVDGSWVVASGLSNRVTWTIDDTNPHTPGGKSGHIHFDQAGNYNFRLTAPIPQLCPTHSYRVSVWAASNMNGSPGQCTICVRLGSSRESCSRPAVRTIESSWMQWTRQIAFSDSGPQPKIEINVSCRIGGSFPFSRDVDIWIDDFSIEDLELFGRRSLTVPPSQLRPYSPFYSA